MATKHRSGPEDRNDRPVEALEPEEFEELVAALLKVDPEGITGQRSSEAKKAKEQDDR